MTKDAIVRRIRELAAARGGRVSFEVFLNETGVKGNWLRGQVWFKGWNPLLKEIGLETRSFGVAKMPKAAIARAVAEVVERDRCWPTQDALVRERKRDPSFPSLKVIGRLRRSGELARLIVGLGQEHTHLTEAAEIARAYVPAEKEDNAAGPNERIVGYVYMLRSGRCYKVGKSTDPSRRYREVRLELPEETHQVHTIPTDDPTGIEAYWHERFAPKRIRNTEFFSLNGQDVQAFKRRKYQ